MRSSDDSGLYERQAEIPAVTTICTSASTAIFLALWLLVPSVSQAFCEEESTTNSRAHPVLYADFWEYDASSITDDKGSLTPEEQNALGAMYLYGWDKERDYQKAKVYLENAKNGPASNDPASNNLGLMYLNGWGVVKDIGKAKAHFEAASEKGYLPALNNLGVTNLKEFDVTNLEESAEEYMNMIQKAAEGNYPPALNNLGVIHLRKEEYGDAVKWFERAADLAYTPALFNLGARYARGEGVEKDHGKAVELYEQAACKGDVDAQYSLGLMYSQGIGVETNLMTAFTWFKVAEGLGSGDAVTIRGVVEKLLTEEQISIATQSAEKLKLEMKIHPVDPSTLYDDVAAAPELYEFTKPTGGKAWIGDYTAGSTTVSP